MRALVVSIFSLLVALLNGAASADYLEVRRSATIRERPARDAAIVARPDIGAELALLDGGRQTGGHYRVRAPSGDVGWIYRTLVRRFPGEPADGGGGGSLEGAAPAAGDMRVHFIDVLQGDAALLEFPCGAVLIDAGGQNREAVQSLIGYLNGFFARRPDLHRTIDTIFITHTHVDHNRALRDIVGGDHFAANPDGAFIVRNYVANGELSGSGRFNARWMDEHANDEGRSIAMRTVLQSEIAGADDRTGITDAVIDPVDCGSIDPRIRVLAGPYEENPGWSDGDFDDGNNKSLVIRIDYGEASLLFTGDLEEAAIETLVDFYEGTGALDVDVYQVGHHGSANGTTDSLLKAMTPEIAVISMGPRSLREKWSAWDYGHPRLSAVEALDRWIDQPREHARSVAVARGVHDFFPYTMRDAVYGTGWDGAVVLHVNGDGTIRVGGPES